MTDRDASLLNTVYIISKGRPQCHTARTVERMGYPGEWFVVCGTNDETLPEYRERWGDHVLTFDFDEQVGRTDPMDGFGFDVKASGAVPVRNATAEISRRRGELRHWQLDDDYTGFQLTDVREMRRPVIKDGAQFERVLARIARFGHECGLANVGFVPASMEAIPQSYGKVAFRVFNAHNMPSGGPLFETWRGRMSDDLVNAIDVWRHGRAELAVKFLSMNMPNTQQEGGGLTEMYREDGTVRKTAYAICACPSSVKLVHKFGRYHHRANWGTIAPKIVSGAYARQ